MRAKMAVQPCSDQWKSITILNLVQKSNAKVRSSLVPPLEILTYAAEIGNKVFMYQECVES